MKRHFVIFGGKSEEFSHLNDTWIFDAKKLTWIKPEIIGNAPSERFFHGCVKRNDYEIIIMGGM